MKLRYILAALAIGVAASTTVQAQKTADQVRIYINPGHGSWTANDRPMTTIDRKPFNDPENVDTTGFFETNTNLQKCFALLYKLHEFGVPFDATKNQDNPNPARVGAALDLTQNIVMSHVKAGPYPTVKMGADPALAEAYNRKLSEVAAEVDANNFDMFISIHSNANVDGDGVNYPLFLYRGSDTEEQCPGSKAMAQAVWPYAFSNPHMDWSYYSMTNMNVRGDWNFYGEKNVWENSKGYKGYLGVLMHTAPGFLVEGYFHTYQPARYRAMNDDVCHQEGIAYARGVAKYFGWEAEKKGHIYGIVRDLHEKFRHDRYHAMATSPSVYRPLNGVTVTLSQAGKQVATYVTDNEYNGAFVFSDLEPGDYTLSYSHPDYKPATEEYLGVVSVKANETSYVSTYLEATAYVPPAIIYVDYPDEINNKAIRAASEYNFSEVYKDVAIAELAGKTIRRAVLRDTNLYVLAVDAAKAPYLYLINTKTNSLARTISTAGTEGTEFALSDIQLTADGVLVGCAKELNHFGDGQVNSGETRGVLNFYKWGNDEGGLPTGDPAVWFTTKKTGNFYRAFAGNTFRYQGTIAEGQVIVTAETTGSTRKVWTVIIPIADGAMVSDASFARPAILTAVAFGDDYTYYTSPLDPKEKYIIAGSKALPMEMLLVDQDEPAHTVLAEGLLNQPTAKLQFFKYAGHSFMVAGDVVEGKNVTKIIDITNGLDKATLVGVNVNNAPAESAAAIVAATGRTIVTNDDEGNTTGAAIELVTVDANGAITKLTTASVEQPKFRGEWAYGLNMVETAGDYTVEFESTGAAPDANIILTNTTTSEQTVIPFGPVVKGANSKVIKGSEILEGEYTWAVEISSKAIPSPSLLFSDKSCLNSRNRGGVAIDRDPESQFFGNIYVSNGRSSGLQIFDPSFTQTALLLKDDFNTGNGSSPYRITTSEGKVYITDWCDNHAGLWMFDPSKASEDKVENVFVGTIQKSGQIVNNGVAVGGGTTGVSFVGTGADRKLFVFCEDIPTGNAGNKVLRYDIGSSLTWDKAPTAQFDAPSAKLINTNVEINAISRGVFCSQIRSKGQNNTGVPAFLFIDFDGNILFNGGDLKTLDGCGGGGLAISDDESMMAVMDGSANIAIFNITWDEKGVPSFEYQYTVPTTGCSEMNQLEFDQAGNIYGYNRDGGLMVYSLPNDAPKALTPARKALVIKGSMSSVEDVVAEAELVVYPNPATTEVNVNAGEEITSIVLYNLNGAQATDQISVDGERATINVEELPSGAYILKVNDKTTKVIKR